MHQRCAPKKRDAPGWRTQSRIMNAVVRIKSIRPESIVLLIAMTKSSSTLDALSQFAAKVDAAIKASPASGIEKNARQHFVSQLAKQGLVTREEYEIQTALLEKSRAKLIALEARIAELESARQQSPKT